MRIGGIVPFTTIDYPGALAAVLFCQGCPWRCHYCHNPQLQTCSKKSPYEWPHIISFLKMRQGFIDAIVLSGGEPTEQKDLVQAVQEIRSLGYKVGLHTAGMHSEALKAVLPLIDWVGMDIKAPFEDYERITRVPHSGQAAKISAGHILNCGAAYEFRTTVHPSLLSRDDLIRMAQQLAAMGVKHYVLQPFRAQGCENADLATSYRHPWDNALIAQFQKLFQTFLIRD
jgi:anaerobic ribonucleoside-triphosphate reductase activating protein